jgi:hypothetical protein
MDDGMEVFSALAEVSYSNEQHSISSLLIHEITTLAAPVDGESALANILVEILCSHWNRCLHQELVPPITTPVPNNSTNPSSPFCPYSTLSSSAITPQTPTI